MGNIGNGSGGRLNRNISKGIWVANKRSAERKEREISGWAKANPEQAKYDQDGNPIERD